MATVPKKTTVQTETLFVRGVTKTNKTFLASSVKPQGFKTQGEFLNAILDDVRKAAGKRRPTVKKKVTVKKKAVLKKKTSRGRKVA